MHGVFLRRPCTADPEEASLWDLQVRVADDPKDQEAALRELVRLVPDEASHSIDLAALLVGQGRQKEARALLEPLAAEGPPSLQRDCSLPACPQLLSPQSMRQGD